MKDKYPTFEKLTVLMITSMKNVIFLFLLCFSLTMQSQDFSDIDENEMPQEIEKINDEILKNPSGDNYYLRGYYYYLNKDYLAAIADYNKAISLDPNNYRFYYSKGNTIIKLKDYKQAIECYTKSIALNNTIQKVDMQTKTAH